MKDVYLMQTENGLENTLSQEIFKILLQPTGSVERNIANETLKYVHFIHI